MLWKPAYYFRPSGGVRPVPGPHQARKSKRNLPEAAVGGEKRVEIGQAVVKAVAHALDGIKRDAAHGGEACDGRGFHVHERGVVGRCQAALFASVCNLRARGEP